MSPLVKALLMLLLAKGASGGFGDIFGRGARARPVPRPTGPAGPGPTGAIPASIPPMPAAARLRTAAISAAGTSMAAAGTWPARSEAGSADPSLPPGDFSDLSGMLDGPAQHTGPEPRSSRTARGISAVSTGWWTVSARAASAT